MTVEQMAESTLTLFVARDEGGRAVGMGALKEHGDGLGEVKRMYTLPDVRGQRVGSQLLQHVELRHEHLDAQLLGVLGLSAAADYGASINSGGPTNTEMILTTTVSRGGQYLVRKTDVYYLENADTPLFLRPSYRNVNMKVVSQ